MMKIRARRQPEEAEIIIIPMIDTMMFLLMFFIVASLALAVQNGLPVNLPKASTGVQHSAQNVTLTLDQAGNLHLNTKAIAVADETSELKTLGVTDSTLVIINADGRVSHGMVTSVMDNARKAGVERFAIATQ
ncbi:MAG: Biopolymer transport protein ExbD/TolR [Capsulimonas sp.]|jgi:biopolymer transport protein ExbD|nr:Biopolymer transport protein ExbD/TolR [Capsulimonas sp.]